MEYIYRKYASPGIWCSLLLPSCLYSLLSIHESELYSLLFATCAWFTAVSFGKEIAFKQEHKTLIDSFPYLSTSLPISIFIWKQYVHYNCFFHAFTLCCLNTWCYNNVIHILLKHCPGSFTLGEVQILSQGISLFLLSCEFFSTGKLYISAHLSDFNEVPSHVKCLQVLVLGSFSLIYLSHKVSSPQRVKIFFSLFLVTSIFMLYAWYFFLGENIFTWLLMFCTEDRKRIYLMLFWIACTVISVLFVIIINLSSMANGSTVIRKFFHFVITAVYVPGILYDLELLRLASGFALCAFLMLELFRILKIPLIGSTIENAFQVFLDEKDTGILILTHIYLLIGCSFPIWIHGYPSTLKNNHVSLFSGIISVGIGDTIAAICGKTFGRYKWRGSNKTYEGSICSLIVQMIFAVMFLDLAGHSFSSINIILIMLAAVMTTFLEAKTDQVDNLVLPLLTFSVLSWIK